MLVVTVRFVAKPEHALQFLHRIRMQASASRESEPGCLQFDVCVDLRDPRQVFLYEVYSSAQAFDEHLVSKHFREFDKETRDWIVSKSAEQWNREWPPQQTRPGT